MPSRWYARPTVSTSVSAPSRPAWRSERVTAPARPGRPGVNRDVILGSALAVGLFLIGILAAGGTELTANTWVQAVLVVLAVGLLAAVLLKGAAGPWWGAGAILAFVALAGLTYASIAWSVQP